MPEDCRERYPRGYPLSEQVALCAIGDDDHDDHDGGPGGACNGDSGGPLLGRTDYLEIFWQLKNLLLRCECGSR